MKRYFVKMLILTLLCFPIYVFADDVYYINSQGVEIPINTYHYLQDIYSDNYLEVMNQDKYDYLIDIGLPFSPITKDVRYIKSEYNNVTGETVETFLTEEEFNNIASTPQVMATFIETGYRYVEITLVRITDNSAFATLFNEWYVLPAVRSYDILAIRWLGATRVNGTQSGTQLYTANNELQYVSYQWNGTNINSFTNGFGISMNLVDAATTLELYIDIALNVNTTGSPVSVYGSYQHALQNVTLATSQSYTLGAGGSDDVVIFSSNSIDSKYQGMGGLYTYITT